jgi:hypothetical protein
MFYFPNFLVNGLFPGLNGIGGRWIDARVDFPASGGLAVKALMLFVAFQMRTANLMMKKEAYDFPALLRISKDVCLYGVVPSETASFILNFAVNLRETTKSWVSPTTKFNASKKLLAKTPTTAE